MLSTICDEEIILDYRSVNCKPSDKFDVFWLAVETVINDKQAAEKRRHGTDSLLPDAMSVKNLCENVKTFLPESATLKNLL
eukprot:TRINITY_DN3421_c0_g2_i1.p1 TRINITY_DN3421_c0_g2~~TRINITY_DN3421_c0_g2_i1.p1  ORF type:complete len:81 (-),score=18.05 TRINITY_DN3421_c0_g2_i1:21-263(-)